MNETNLLKLADYLTTLKPEQFDILSYRRTSDGGVARFKSTTDCGTVGCALGWAPFVIPVEANDFRENGAFDWLRYCIRICGFQRLSYERYWCFSWRWASIDNTPTGASLRIRELVINGLPKDAAEQLKGKTIYMFKKEQSDE